MTESTIILNAIKEAVRKIEPGVLLVLFGSRARGHAHNESDWDILILTKRNVTWDYKNEITDSLFYVGLKYAVTINSLIVNKEQWQCKFQDWPIHSEVEKDGVLL